MVTVVKHILKDPFQARVIRLHPTDYSVHVSLRWELYGCKAGGMHKQPYITQILDIDRMLVILIVLPSLHYLATVVVPYRAQLCYNTITIYTIEFKKNTVYT